jgi:hypothetical protein
MTTDATSPTTGTPPAPATSTGETGSAQTYHLFIKAGAQIGSPFRYHAPDRSQFLKTVLETGAGMTDPTGPSSTSPQFQR